MKFVELYFGLSFWSAVVCYGLLALSLITFGVLVAWDKFKKRKTNKKDGE